MGETTGPEETTGPKQKTRPKPITIPEDAISQDTTSPIFSSFIPFTENSLKSLKTRLEQLNTEETTVSFLDPDPDEDLEEYRRLPACLGNIPAVLVAKPIEDLDGQSPYTHYWDKCVSGFIISELCL